MCEQRNKDQEKNQLKSAKGRTPGTYTNRTLIASIEDFTIQMESGRQLKTVLHQ